jgi:hypothetical protein
MDSKRTFEVQAKLSPNGARLQSPGQDHEVIAALGSLGAQMVFGRSPEGAGQSAVRAAVSPFQGLSLSIDNLSSLTQDCIRCANLPWALFSRPFRTEPQMRTTTLGFQ